MASIRVNWFLRTAAVILVAAICMLILTHTLSPGNRGAAVKGLSRATGGAM